MGTKNLNSATDLITFSRASGGTALRKISYGSELVTNGDFSNGSTGWLQQGGWTFASGKATNDGTNDYSLQQLNLVTVGKTYRITYDVSDYVSGNISVGLNSGGGSTTVAANGSYEVIETATQTYFKGYPRSSFVGSIDNVSVKEVLYDQPDGTLQLFNSPANVPRIEYNADGTVKGLLIEEARTNEISTSEVAPTAYSSGITKAVDSSVVSPSGGSNVEKFTLSSANEQHYVGNHNHISASSGTSTYSIFAKGSGHNLIRLRMANTSGSFSCDFNLSTGQKQVTSVADSSVIGAIESMGNGWWRCSMTYASEKTNPYASVFLINAMDAPLSNSFLGDGTSGVYVWGSQYEAGAFPTSYMPTSGNPATRAADVASIPVSDFGYNQKQGSIVVEFDSAKLTNSGIYSLYADGSNGLTALVYPSNRVSYQVVDGGAFQVNDNFADYNVSGQTSKVATTYSNNDFAAVLDGGAVSSDTGGSVPTATSIVLGNYLSLLGSSFQMSGHIKSIKYYPRRLTNTQLQELTT